jgi:hypothetical protein
MQNLSYQDLDLSEHDASTVEARTEMTVIAASKKLHAGIIKSCTTGVGLAGCLRPGSWFPCSLAGRIDESAGCVRVRLSWLCQLVPSPVQNRAPWLQ